MVGGSAFGLWLTVLSKTSSDFSSLQLESGLDLQTPGHSLTGGFHSWRWALTSS